MSRITLGVTSQYHHLPLIFVTVSLHLQPISLHHCSHSLQYLFLCLLLPTQHATDQSHALLIYPFKILQILCTGLDELLQFTRYLLLFALFTVVVEQRREGEGGSDCHRIQPYGYRARPQQECSSEHLLRQLSETLLEDTLRNLFHHLRALFSFSKRRYHGESGHQLVFFGGREEGGEVGKADQIFKMLAVEGVFP